MAPFSDARPFSNRVAELRGRGYRYADLEEKSRRARSTAWFNKLMNSSSPWVVSPPDQGTLEALAELLETTARHVAEMVAQEWYGVKRTEQSPRVAALTPRLDALTKEDAELVESLIQRLQPRTEAESQ